MNELPEREYQWRLHAVEEKQKDLDRRTERVAVMDADIGNLWKAIDRLSGSIDNLRRDMNANVDKLESAMERDVEKITGKQDRNNSVLIGAAVTFGVSALMIAGTVYTVFA